VSPGLGKESGQTGALNGHGDLGILPLRPETAAYGLNAGRLSSNLVESCDYFSLLICDGCSPGSGRVNAYLILNCTSIWSAQLSRSEARDNEHLRSGCRGRVGRSLRFAACDIEGYDVHRQSRYSQYRKHGDRYQQDCDTSLPIPLP